MSFLDDIFSLMRRGRTATKDFEDLASLNTKSIARQSQDATMQFPCILPDTIPLNLASVIVKNMDRVYASFVQTVIASNPLIDITIDRSPLDYIKRLHQNMRLESAIDEEAIFASWNAEKELRETLMQECPNLVVPEDLYESVNERVYNGGYKLFMNSLGTFGVAFNEAVLQDADPTYLESLRESLSDFDLKPFPVTEANDPAKKSTILSGMLGSAGEPGALTKELSAPRLLDRDAKRYNELQPYGLSVRLMAVNDKKEFVQYIDFVVGIKAIMHVVKSKEIVTAAGSILQNRNAIFNFIRWTTGEISLVKDLLLHVDELKTDASYRSRGASPWFPSLKRMKEKKVQFSLSGAKKLLPNATLVLSSFEVDDIRRTYGFDVRDVYFAKKLMSELFLLTFIIEDEGSETIDILYESSESFETYTLETLQKEVDMSSNKLGKEIGRMISQ